ncbi:MULTISPECIES: carbonic anhydrase [Rhodomicrobium]|uniref:carbonic anhydrase n=1 Tax=Rhodomicrobium TaxID=1068 RepID=UPI000B4B5A00|nr:MULTISPECIES: carbonic anhydrase [Rhodomicrobium]
MSDLNEILARNAEWARQRVEQDPDYFSRLTGLQAPEILWIGCSDSRVPANVITGLEPGEVFVHRNVANLVYSADINCMSVLQFAVEMLRVKHVIVCGHYGCGGVRAALRGDSEGLIDHWLEPVKQLARARDGHLATLPDDEARINFLCEENVRSQVANLAFSPVMRLARERGQDITLHGWVYGLDNGLLRDLKCGEVGLR